MSITSMKVQLVLIVLIILSLAIVPDQASADTSAGDTYTITVEIKNLQSNSGKVVIALFNSKETYMENPLKESSADIN